MNGNIYASSLSASSIVLTANTAISAHSSYYAVIADNGCTAITLPSLAITPTGALAINNRMLMVKNISSTNVTVTASGGNTFDGGSTTMVLRPFQWAILHGQNDASRWNVYRPDSPGIQTTDVTYAQLMNLIGVTAATGTTSGFYRITDYATRGFIIGGSGAAYTGTTEPLIVNIYFNSAMGTTAQISREAFSPRFPNDIIHYDPYPQNWYSDKSFCTTYDATGMVSNFKGVIYFRHDLKKNIKGTYDWRYCRTRRWQVSTAIPVYNPATAYQAGDVVLTIAGPPYVPVAKIVSDGPTGGTIDTTWALVPPAVFAVDPYNNENLSPSSSWRWDLCVNNYAHSGTGATFAVILPLDLSVPSDATTFVPHNGGLVTDDPLYTRDIDLGSFRWNLGESLMPTPFGGGPTAGSAARSYGTIVNQNRLNCGSVGLAGVNGSVGFNRLHNVSFGPRAWGNTLGSAGFEAIDNDTYDVTFVGRAENNCLDPYPIIPISAVGASTINAVAGFRHVRVQEAVNCQFLSSVLNSEFGSIRDSWIINSAALDIGNANAIGPFEYTQGATYQSWDQRGFSIGNIFRDCANLKTNQVRWSFFDDVRASKFSDVNKVYMDCAPADNVVISGDFRNTTFVGTSIFATEFAGRLINCYFGNCTLNSNAFRGSVYNNVFDSWTMDRNNVYGDFLNVGASSASTYLGNNTFMHEVNWGATALSVFASSNYLGSPFGPNTWGSGANFNNNRIDGTFYDNHVELEFSRCSVHGDVYTNYFITVSNITVMAGMTGVTGLTVKNAIVVGPALDALDMSSATQSDTDFTKIYGISDAGTQLLARMRDVAGVGSWQFFGATA